RLDSRSYPITEDRGWTAAPTSLEGVFERDRGEAVDRFDALRHLRVPPQPVRQHHAEVADEPGPQLRDRFDHRVGRAALRHEPLPELRTVGDRPEVFRRAANDGVPLPRAVEPSGLPRTGTDAEIEHVALSIDHPSTITDGFRYL